MNKSYWEIVKTCKLRDYREELAGKHSVWMEYWQDSNKEYAALFTNNQTGFLPFTIFTKLLNE